MNIPLIVSDLILGYVNILFSHYYLTSKIYIIRLCYKMTRYL